MLDMQDATKVNLSRNQAMVVWRQEGRLVEWKRECRTECPPHGRDLVG